MLLAACDFGDKSERVCFGHGVGEKGVKRQLTFNGNATWLALPIWNRATIHCASLCEHVGTKPAFDFCTREEVSARCAVPRQSFGKLRTNIFMNRSTEVRKRP